MRLAPLVLAATLAAATPMQLHRPAHQHRQVLSFIESIINPNPGTEAAATTAITTTPVQTGAAAETTPAATSNNAVTSKEPVTSALVSSAPATSVAPTTSASPTSAPATSASPSAAPETATSEAPVESAETSSSEAATTSSSSAQQPHTEYVTVNGVISTVDSSSSATGAADKSKETGLSKGAIIGIAVGAAAGVIALVALLIMLLRRKRSSDDEAIRWPELNRHGDADVIHALPAHNVGGGSRMSLGSDLEDDPQYITVTQGAAGDHLNGSNFASNQMLDPYDEKAGGMYDPGQHGHIAPGGQYAYSDEDYTSYPPAVQQQPSPVHGAPPYDWESHDGHYNQDQGYAGMTRQESPPMAGVSAGAGGLTPMPYQNTRY